MAERIFEQAIAIAPEHVGGRHDRGGAGTHGAIESSVGIGERAG